MGSITDQSCRLINLLHDLIAHVNTRSTVHALQLGPIPDVNSGWANSYTLLTINTISSITILYIFFQLPSWLTPHMIITDHNRVVIQQHSLKSSVWTDHRTGLLPKP